MILNNGEKVKDTYSHLHSHLGTKILPQAGSRAWQVRTPRHPVQAVLATLAEVVLAILAVVTRARTTHVVVVLDRTTPLVAAHVPPPTPPDEEA
jgi:hypothetical protein